MAFQYSREQALSTSALNPTKSTTSRQKEPEEKVATRERLSSSRTSHNKEKARIAAEAEAQGASEEVIHAIQQDQYSVDKKTGQVTVNYTEQQANLRSQAPTSTDAPSTQATTSPKDDVYFNPQDTIRDEVRDEKGRVIGFRDTLTMQSVLAGKDQYYPDETIKKEEERRQKQFIIEGKRQKLEKQYLTRVAEIKSEHKQPSALVNVATFGILSNIRQTKQDEALAKLNTAYKSSELTILTGDTISQRQQKVTKNLFDTKIETDTYLKIEGGRVVGTETKQREVKTLKDEILRPPININLKVDEDLLLQVKGKIDEKGGFFKDGKIYKRGGLNVDTVDELQRKQLSTGYLTHKAVTRSTSLEQYAEYLPEEKRVRELGEYNQQQINEFILKEDLKTIGVTAGTMFVTAGAGIVLGKASLVLAGKAAAGVKVAKVAVPLVKGAGTVLKVAYPYSLVKRSVGVGYDVIDDKPIAARLKGARLVGEAVGVYSGMSAAKKYFQVEKSSVKFKDISTEKGADSSTTISRGTLKTRLGAKKTFELRTTLDTGSGRNTFDLKVYDVKTGKQFFTRTGLFTTTTDVVKKGDLLYLVSQELTVKPKVGKQEKFRIHQNIKYIETGKPKYNVVLETDKFVVIEAGGKYQQLSTSQFKNLQKTGSFKKLAGGTITQDKKGLFYTKSEVQEVSALSRTKTSPKFDTEVVDRFTQFRNPKGFYIQSDSYVKDVGKETIRVGSQLLASKKAFALSPSYVTTPQPPPTKVKLIPESAFASSILVEAPTTAQFAPLILSPSNIQSKVQPLSLQRISSDSVLDTESIIDKSFTGELGKTLIDVKPIVDEVAIPYSGSGSRGKSSIVQETAVQTDTAVESIIDTQIASDVVTTPEVIPKSVVPAPIIPPLPLFLPSIGLLKGQSKPSTVPKFAKKTRVTPSLLGIEQNIKGSGRTRFSGLETRGIPKEQYTGKQKAVKIVPAIKPLKLGKKKKKKDELSFGDYKKSKGLPKLKLGGFKL